MDGFILSHILKREEGYNKIRMHSSRMRFVRSSNKVYPSMHWALCIPACTGQGVCVSQHGCLPGGGCLYGGCLPRGCLPGGGVCLEGVSAQGVSAWGCLLGDVSQHALRQTPPMNRMTD